MKQIYTLHGQGKSMKDCVCAKCNNLGLDDTVDFLTVALPRLLVDKVDLVQKVRAAPLVYIPERAPLVVSMRVRLNLVYGAVAKAGLNLVISTGPRVSRFGRDRCIHGAL